MCNVESHLAGNDVGPRVDSDGAATTTNDHTEVELVYCRAESREAWTFLWHRQKIAPTSRDVNISDASTITAAVSERDVTAEQPNKPSTKVKNRY